MKYIIVIGAFLLSLLIIGCGGNRTYYSSASKRSAANFLVGSWYTQGVKYHRKSLQIRERRKEQFFRNGQLLSSKWFAIRDRAGRDLGEFYITKLFTWKLRGNRVIAKFQRCDVGVVRALKAPNIGYSKLKRACRYSLKRRGKITVKRIKFINTREIMLGDKIYRKEH